MTHATAPPRIRFKRPKWPSGRTLFWLAVLVVILGFIALDTLKILQGDWSATISMTVWTFAFAANYAAYQRHRRAENSAETLPPPIPAFYKAWLAMAIVLEVIEWATL